MKIRISDLFKPKWKLEYSAKINASIKEITNQKKLIKIALTSPWPTYRKEATSKISDKETLNYIALNDESEDVRVEAIGKMENQELLKSIVLSNKHDKDWNSNDWEKFRALARIKDNNFLYDVASRKLNITVNENKNRDKYYYRKQVNDLCSSALTQITDEKMQLQLFFDNKFYWSEDVSNQIVDKFNSEEILTNIALNHYDNHTRLNAALKLKKQEVLFRLINDIHEHYIWEKSLPILSRNYLNKIYNNALSSNNIGLAVHALRYTKKITKEHVDFLLNHITDFKYELEPILITIAQHSPELLLSHWNKIYNALLIPHTDKRTQYGHTDKSMNILIEGAHEDIWEVDRHEDFGGTNFPEKPPKL